MSETNSNTEMDSPTPSLIDLDDTMCELSTISSMTAHFAAPIDTADPLLLSRIHRIIRNSENLRPRERRILRAVMANMPSQEENDNAVLRRMIELSAAQLKLLAKIFEDGLRAVWELGSILPATDTADDAKNKMGETSTDHTADEQKMWKGVVFDESGPEMAICYDAINERSSPVRLLFDALGVEQTLPNIHHVHHKKGGRHANLPEACEARHNSTCPISGLDKDIFHIETAILVPHTVAAIETAEDAPFWRLLRLFLGPSLTDEIYGIAGGLNSFKTTNALCLGSGLGEGVFDNGVFYLIPCLPDGFFLELMNSYDVEFKWRGDNRLLRSFITFLPQDPDDQIKYSGAYNLLDEPRQIKSGDCFRLFTRDPGQFPLPHPLLLSLHAILWEVITTSGVSETFALRSPSSDGSLDGNSITSGTPSELENMARAAIIRPLAVEYVDFRLNQLIAFQPIKEIDMGDEEKNDQDEIMGGRLWEVDQFDTQMVENGFYDAEKSARSPSNDPTDCDEEEMDIAMTTELVLEYDGFHRRLAHRGYYGDGTFP